MDGSIHVHRPERVFPPFPAPQVLLLPAVPAQPSTGSPGRAELIPMLIAAGSGAGFALVSGNRTYLVLAVVLLLASVTGSVASRAAAQRQAHRRWADTRERHLAAVERVSGHARVAAEAQLAALARVHPPPSDLLAAVRAGALWERRPHHLDFGTIRLGLGRVPALVSIDEPPGAGSTTSGDAELAASNATARRAHAQLEAAPVTTELTRLSCVAVVGDAAACRTLVTGWLAQLAALHSPGDLGFLALVPEHELSVWEWLKWLPHTHDRALGRSVARLARRVGSNPQLVADLAADRTGTHHILVVDGYRPSPESAGRNQLDESLRLCTDLAVTAIVLCEGQGDVPARCSATVELAEDGTATFTEAGAQRAAVDFVPERCDTGTATPLARWLAPRRVREDTSGALGAGDVRLTELVAADGDGGDGQSRGGLLRAPLGRRDGARPLWLDLREASVGGAGPHGILVGATGSGKSELMRSLVLGLSRASSPLMFTTLLIDFKGGAAFRDLAALPHSVGLVTNLGDDLRLVDRVQAALSGEIVRRQQLLQDAGGVESIRAYHATATPQSAPLPYLLVLVDEFGELLEARPDFLTTFTTIGRLGRSLGIHLLLASQRLDEGRLRGLESHLSYRIALRTFTAAESHAVIGSAAAAELPPVPGLGYLSAGGEIVGFRAATTNLPAGTRCDSSPAGSGQLVRSFSLTSSRPVDVRGTENPAGSGSAIPSARRDLDVLVDATRRRYAELRAPAIWLPPLPERLPLAQLPGPGSLAEAAIGLLDDPVGQDQRPFSVRLLGDDAHLAIVGAPRSGRSTFLRTLVHSLVASEPPERLQVYVLDLGGSLPSLARLPHTGAVAGRSDGPAVRRVLAELSATVDDRSRALQAAGCATLAELEQRPDREQWLPDPLRAHLLLLVDGVAQLRAEHPEAEQQLAELAAAGSALGLHLAVTANRWTEIRQPILDAISSRLELWLLDPADSRHGRTLAATLPRVPGRALDPFGREVQLAEPAEHPRLATSTHTAVGIAPLPSWVDAAQAPTDGDATLFALGLQEHRQAWVDLDLLGPGAHLLVYGDGGSGRTALLRRVIRSLGSVPERVRLHLVDPGRGLAEIADNPAVVSYAYDRASATTLADELDQLLAEREPPPGLAPRELARGAWWSGPEHVLVVDDLDLLLGSHGSPFVVLGDHVRAARDRGVHVVVSRRVAGAARGAFEPFLSAVRESAPLGLVLCGDRSEGPLVADVAAQWHPPGRGFLVRPGRRPVLIQVAAEAGT